MKIFEEAKKQLQLNLPFVLYAKPNENKLNAIFQEDDLVHNFVDQSGFVFVSFDKKEQIVLPLDASKFLIENIFFDDNFDSEMIKINYVNEEKIKFKNLVNASIEVIKKGAFDKLVVSRKIDFTEQVNVFITFQNLIKSYETAFRYVFFHPKVGLWMGATPELLIKTNDNLFETVSLAGTKLFSNDDNWTPKEIQEQQFVTDYIVSNIKSYASNVEVSKPKNVQAGKLSHIKTIISGQLTKGNRMDLINILHPTPAICGLPKEAAFNFIVKNEHYNRKFYAGFLGEWNLNLETNLFVNLRCMELGKINSIYVGCGITKDSTAEKEFIETENKSQTMQNIINLQT
ncbi:isochorismate synthase [uncultured Flavobacterium sp.]|uniref:isochorismate synthase n=1 Tax=uncultured Flavobacterium sp. TaxID=165435 RepID=UPI0030CA3FB7|tara:strand:- start:125 stop:1156 length:1032 start_codon:yes stop_codon:yes gene_type:complete